jgi:glycosyltransferase involved in cell wall biosynthesis
MKIVTVHTYYQQRGGEDISYEMEKRLLQKYGHHVVAFEKSNHLLNLYHPLKMGLITIWNQEIFKEFINFLNLHKPDVVYVTNTFPLLSPSVYRASLNLGIPIVQSLQNFRLMCLNGLFLRKGKICELCKGKFPWYGILYRCYRDNYLASCLVAIMLGFNRLIDTYSQIDGYIVLTEFSRNKFIEGGFHQDRLYKKPNFLEMDRISEMDRRAGMIYVGRLSEEKGIDILLQAIELISGKIPVRLLGNGPLRTFVEKKVSRLSRVRWLGEASSLDVLKEIAGSRALVFPSLCYEQFPRVFLEAFATGTPVIASKLGAGEELIENQVTGLHFMPGDANDLAEKMLWLYNHENDGLSMGKNARKEYLEKYTAEKNYDLLINIFKQILSC